MHRHLLLPVLVLLLAAPAHADEVFLKGGGKLSGRILARTDASVQVDVGAGTITVPMSSVVRIEEGRSILHEYQERVARLADDDVQGWLEVARWAKSQGLATQARRAYERVVALDPQNAEANLALGRVQLDGRWVSAEEGYRARGFVQFEGQWMKPEERDTIVAEREARYTELALLDAERRARDAEVRALEAEMRAEQAQGPTQYTVGIPLWGAGFGFGYAPNYGYKGRYPRGGTKGGPPPLGTYPTGPLGVYPSHPIGGVWPNFGGRPAFPIGPAGNFPIGPSPPGSTFPGRVTGPPRGGPGRGAGRGPGGPGRGPGAGPPGGGAPRSVTIPGRSGGLASPPPPPPSPQ